MPPEYTKIRSKRAKLARGLLATVENNRLRLTQNGHPFRQFRLSNDDDWMRGAFYVRNEAFYVWDNRRFRKRPDKTDCASHVLNTIALLVNRAAGAVSVVEDATST